MSKTSKQRKTTKIIKLHEFHRFDVQTIKTTQNSESDQNNAKLASSWRQNEQWLASIYDGKTIQINAKLLNAIKLRWICIDMTSKRY